MRIVFLISFLVFFTGYIFWKFMTLFPQNRLLASGISIALIFLSLSWLFVSRANPHSIDESWMKAWIWTGSVAMGFLGTFILFFLVLDVLKLVEMPFKNILPFEESRRDLFFDWMAKGIAFSSIGVTAWGLKTALKGAEIKNVTVPLKTWNPSLESLVLAQISDLHVGLTIEKKYVVDVVKKTMALNPDLIFVTGDLADGDPESLKERWLPLKELKAPLGVYFVTGNHEYYSGVEKWLSAVQEMGFIPLVNESKKINYKGASILVCGVPDVTGGAFNPDHHPNYEKARGTENADLKILLAHRPEVSDEAERLGFDLQLSGHTHAGQFFPFSILVSFVHRHNQGLSFQGPLAVYVNQGTGYWGPANRFAVPSEITKIQFMKS